MTARRRAGNWPGPAEVREQTRQQARRRRSRSDQHGSSQPGVHQPPLLNARLAHDKDTPIPAIISTLSTRNLPT